MNLIHRLLFGVGMLVIAVLALPVGPTHAGTTYIVTRTSDIPFDEVCDTDCSLREAIWYANGFAGADTIVVPAGTYTLDLVGVENNNEFGDLDISEDVTIEGTGAGETIIDGNGTITGDRILHITGGNVTIAGVTIRGGHQFGDDGGGILNQGSLTLWNSTVNGNVANRGGGIANWGTLSLYDSTVSSNTGGSGGGVYNGGQLTVNGSTVNGNTASNGGGIYTDGSSSITGSSVSGNEAIYNGIFTNTGLGGGIYYQGGTHTLNSTTIANNTVGSGGGGLVLISSWVTLTDSIVSSNYGFSSGGGILSAGYLGLTRTSVFGNSAASGGGLNNQGTTTVINSTISGNAADARGGGIQNSSGSVTLTNSTVTGNSAPEGGGLYNWAGEYIQARNTIVANNPLGGNCAGGTMTSAGFNLSSDATCTWIGLGDINNAWSGLGPLAYNGGATPTHALLQGSPAADGGGPGCPTTDQRGISRPQGVRCDIGAFEALDTDADGVSDPADDDDDNDGSLDANDPCPLLAEDFDGFQDSDGCPDYDNDMDGVCDAHFNGAAPLGAACSGIDQGRACYDPAGTLYCPITNCSNTAEDFDGFRDLDGCPDPDNDNDSFPDFADDCPGTDSVSGTDGMLGSPQDLNHNGIQDGGEASHSTDDSALTFEDFDGVLDFDGCHDSPGDDYDGDGLTDEFEVFVLSTLPYNPDTDADSHLDGADNCPQWANAAQNVPAWPIPANDADCDGFSSQLELTIGTDPTRQCPVAGEPDAWPVDFNKSGVVNITDVLALKPVIQQTVPPASPRFDLNASGVINITDVLAIKPFIQQSCS